MLIGLDKTQPKASGVQPVLQIGLISCVGCRGTYFAAGAWKHGKCRDLLDAKAVEVKPASNRLVVEGASPASNRKQRWSREGYNEYMRAYMARRRKEARNGDHA